MAARGSEAKEFITKKLLETFDGSFLYNNGKEIRIPVTENGENLQIKIAHEVHIQTHRDPDHLINSCFLLFFPKAGRQQS